MRIHPQAFYKQVKYLILPFYKLMGSRFVKDLEYELGASGLDDYKETVRLARKELEAGDS